MARKKERGNGSGSVYPRKNKQGKIIGYRGSYFAPDGKRRYVSAKRKGDAEKALRQAMTDADRGFVFDGGTLALEDYLTRWLTNSVKDTVRRSTFVQYKSVVYRHLIPALGRLKLKALTPAHARSLYREKLDCELSPRTVQYIHVTLHKALKQAVMDGLIPRNVTDAVKAPQVLRKEVKPMSASQVRALLTAASGDRLETLYVVAVHTGLRQGELLGLKWGDTNLEAGSFSVEAAPDTEGTLNPPK